MSELRNKVEALLFAVGKHIDIEEICRITEASSKDEVSKALNEIKQDYDKRESPIMVVSEGNAWKLTVREKFLGMVKHLVAETELSKTILETLAVITWKNPVKQSEVIKIRTNKAYDHVQELEELGFISRTKHGRTMLIKLTDKFYNYFELTGDADIREVFEKVGVDEAMQKKVDEYANGKLGELKVYEESEADKKELEEREEASKSKLGNLEIVDETKQEQDTQDTTKPIETPEKLEDNLNKIQNDVHELEDDDSRDVEDSSETEEDSDEEPKDETEEENPNPEDEEPESELENREDEENDKRDDSEEEPKETDEKDEDIDKEKPPETASEHESEELEDLFDKANKEAEDLMKRKNIE